MATRVKSPRARDGAAPNRARVIQAMRTADEARLVEALQLCEQKMVQAFAEEVQAMSLALRTATQSGGRRAFESEAKRWQKHRAYKELMLRVDHWLTRMPSPRPPPAKDS